VKQIITLLSFIFLLSQHLGSQNLLSVQFLGKVSKTSLEQQFFQTFHNGADRYRVTYETTGIDGNTTIASGLVCLPDNLTKRYPVVCYQHGTASDDDQVPSNLSFDSTFPVALCGKGYLAVAPDYLGLGASQGVHPYVHAASEAWVAVDLMRAAFELAAQKNLAFNEQVFVTGYSQGGHAAMALHQMLEQELADEFKVTASAPMSGPYSIGEVMRDLIVSGEEYGRPGYLINTIVSYQYVYGDLFNSFEDAFKPEYLGLVGQFYNEEISLGTVDTELANLLSVNEGAIIPIKLLRDDFVAEFINNPNHPANLRMIENNTYDWAPEAPTRLFYCMADEQVPFENSILAASAMEANGAADVEAINLSSTADHVSCAFLAALNMITFFENYQEIEDLPVAVFEPLAASLEVFPNPASEAVVLKNLAEEGVLRIMDWQGKTLLQKEVNAGDFEISLEGLVSGMYFLEFNGIQTKSTGKLVVNK
jgi:acetyl esterase/lipase